MRSLFLPLLCVPLLTTSCIATSGDLARIEGSIQSEMESYRDGAQSFEAAINNVRGEVSNVAKEVSARGEAAWENAKQTGIDLLMYTLFGVGGVGAVAGRKRIAAAAKAAVAKPEQPPAV